MSYILAQLSCMMDLRPFPIGQLPSDEGGLCIKTNLYLVLLLFFISMFSWLGTLDSVVSPARESL